LIKHKNIVNYIKAQRPSCFGHVQRMPDARTVKKIFNWKPPTNRQMGGKHQTGHLLNEDQKLDILRPGSRDMEEGGR
jgi:hypothetical protein